MQRWSALARRVIGASLRSACVRYRASPSARGPWSCRRSWPLRLPERALVRCTVTAARRSSESASPSRSPERTRACRIRNGSAGGLCGACFQRQHLGRPRPGAFCHRAQLAGRSHRRTGRRMRRGAEASTVRACLSRPTHVTTPAAPRNRRRRPAPRFSISRCRPVLATGALAARRGSATRLAECPAL
jgi:hypothetical protein